MASIKFGVSVVGARGTAGGLTFSANKAGPYFKTWSKSANPRSVLQSAQRNKLADFAANWRNLTQVQRDDWDDYADDAAQELTNSLGETYFISGFNWYVRINLNLQAGGDSPRVDAPTLTRPLAPIIELLLFRTTVSALSSNIRYTVADPALAALHGVHGIVVSSQGIAAIPTPAPFIRIAVPDGGRRVFFQTELEDKFGTLVAGQRFLTTTFIQDAHGQRGPVDSDFADASP